MTGADKLSKLPPEVRERLNPFPSISPQTGIANKVKFRNPFTGEYILAEPYNRIYHEESTVFIDITKVFAQKVGARGTLIIGPKATGKTHLLAIEADYIKRRYKGKIIMVHDKEYREYVELADVRVRVEEVKGEKSIIKAICKKLNAQCSDVDALRDAISPVSERGWDAVQIIIDDIYEPLWSRREDILREIFELFRLHTVSKPPIIRTSVAIHTGEKGSRARDFFDIAKDELTMLIYSYENGEEFTQRVIENMMRGKVVLGATVIPIVTEWHFYIDEGEVEKAFKDFFSKYVATVEDPDLHNLKLEELVDESRIMQVVVEASKWGAYRVFADECNKIWLNFKGEKLRGDEVYTNVLNKYGELVKKRNEAAQTGKLHKFYKELLEDIAKKIMEVKGAQLRTTRRYRVVSDKVRWRTINYYAVNGETIVVVIPQLVTRKSGVVVERPNEVIGKIEDIHQMIPTAQIIGIVTEDVDDRGLRDALGKANYAEIKLPSPVKDSALKYFYAPLLSSAIDRAWLQYLLERYVRETPGSAITAVRVFKALR